MERDSSTGWKQLHLLPVLWRCTCANTVLTFYRLFDITIDFDFAFLLWFGDEVKRKLHNTYIQQTFTTFRLFVADFQCVCCWHSADPYRRFSLRFCNVTKQSRRTTRRGKKKHTTLSQRRTPQKKNDQFIQLITRNCWEGLKHDGVGGRSFGDKVTVKRG